MSWGARPHHRPLSRMNGEIEDWAGEQQLANQALHQRRLRIEPVTQQRQALSHREGPDTPVEARGP